jgi:hypothetical protein
MYSNERFLVFIDLSVYPLTWVTSAFPARFAQPLMSVVLRVEVVIRRTGKFEPSSTPAPLQRPLRIFPDRILV